MRISNTAIDKFLSESSVGKSENKDVHLSVLRVLPEVLRESIDAEQHPDYNKGTDGKRSPENGTNPDVTIHRLYGAVDIDGKPYRVKITLKEDARNSSLPKKAYNYEATKIELLTGTLGKLESDAPSANNSITAAKLLQGVEKSYKEGELLMREANAMEKASGIKASDFENAYPCYLSWTTTQKRTLKIKYFVDFQRFVFPCSARQA